MFISLGPTPPRFPLYGYRSQGGEEPSIAGGTLDKCNGHTHAIDLPESEGGTVRQRERDWSVVVGWILARR